MNGSPLGPEPATGQAEYWRARARAAEAEVERLRGIVTRASELVSQLLAGSKKEKG